MNLEGCDRKLVVPALARCDFR